MTVVAISGILLALAMPSFREAIVRNRIATETNTLLTSFAFARAEAIRRNNRVGVCALNAGGTACAADNWNRGWLVWVDTNRSGAFDAANDEVLRITRLSSEDTLDGGGVLNVHFGPRGTRVTPAAGTSTALVLRPASCYAGLRNVRTLSVLATGSANTAESPCP
jgi:type IV fimbrial biogenesis protein FimT